MYCLDCGDESCLKCQTIKFNEEQRFEHKDRVTAKAEREKRFKNSRKLYLESEDIYNDAHRRAIHHRNRNFLIESDSNFEKSQIPKLLEEQEWKCAGCGISFKNEPYEVDHKQPIALGGTNSKDNIQLLCYKCNRSKNNMEYSKWKSLIAYRNVVNTLIQLAEDGH